MQNDVAINTLDRLIPSIRETGDPEGVVLKFASSENLAAAQLDKLGQLFNISKTITYMSKAANRGGSFKLLDIQEMLSKYASFTPVGSQQKTASVKPSEFLKSASVSEDHDAFAFPSFYKAAKEGREEFVDNGNPLEPTAVEVQVKKAYDATIQELSDAGNRQKVEDFIFDQNMNIEECAAHLTKRARQGLSLEDLIRDAFALHPETKTACAFLQKYASEKLPVALVDLEAVPVRQLYRDTTGELSTVVKMASAFELVSGAKTYIEKFATYTATEKETKTGNPGGVSVGRNSFGLPIPTTATQRSDSGGRSQSGGGSSGGFSGGSHGGGGSAGSALTASQLLSIPLHAPDILRQDSLVYNKRQDDIDTALDESVFMANLQSLIVSDPVISEASDKAIMNAANSIRTAAPDVTKHPAELRWLLREVLQYDADDGNVPAHIISDLQSRQSGAVKNRTDAERSKVERYGAGDGRPKPKPKK